LKGRVLAVHSSECTVALGEKTQSCKFRGRLRQEDTEICAGDVVEVSQVNGGFIVEKVLPRKNILIRPPVANVDQVVVVTAISKPPLDLLYIDRVLVHLEAQDISGIICVNKHDIEKAEDIEKVVRIYSSAGYPCVVTSAVTGYGMNNLAQYMEEKVTVLAGQSGTGKSKILSTLLGVGLLTGNLSRLGRGRHTTKGVKLFRTKQDGFVADTPGFSKIDLFEVEPHELGYYYPEMSRHAPSCHFPRCLHRTETRCAVKNAVDEGKIARERYENYLILLEECVERAKRRYE